MNKITDAEIEKALECCVKAENIGDCMILECPLMGDYGCEISGEEEKLFSLALGYINRLKAKSKEQQAEIERLQKECADKERAYTEEYILRKEYKTDIERIRELTRVVYGKEIAEAKSEAIKEFVERLKAASHPYADTQMVFELQIDNLVKEMTKE